MPAKILFYLLSLGLFSGCLSEPRQKKSSDLTGEAGQPIEAKGFKITSCKGYQLITVIDPWQKASDNRFDYYLLERGKEVPAELIGKQIFFTPANRVICLSTTHIGFLDALGELTSVTGMSGSAYLTNSTVKHGLAENRIREVGYESGLNYELILQLKPDIVFAYGVGSEINSQITKMRDLGIPVVLVGEYLEQSPLGKAEWIKFFGAFYGKGETALQAWDKIKGSYEAIMSRAAQFPGKPSVLTGLPFKDTWWMAGGLSNLATLIRDAGGKFLWAENSSKEAFPVSLEEVFLRASDADIWINCGSVNDLEGLMAFDPRFAELPVVKNSQVFNNNLRSNAAGGNDYWESGVVHPDRLLLDLVRIFHPEEANDEDFTYYKKIK